MATKKRAGKSIPKKSAKKKVAKKKIAPIPKGYSSLTAYISVRGAAKAIEFYQKAFSARIRGQIAMQDGKVGHAELQIGDSVLMLSDEMPEWGNVGPETLGGTPVGICLYVKDVDKVFATAVTCGAKVERDLQNQFYGDRTGTLVDPFGHKWTIATHIEDVSFKEMQKRSDKMLAAT